LVSSDLAVVKIIDFGTAQLTGDICEDSKAVGSRWWSPPEQVSKGLYSAMAADMFSVGALLFTLLSGDLFCRTEEDYRKVIVRFDRQPSETYWNRITDEAKDLSTVKFQPPPVRFS
jgi:serine/threonine protein kinase